MKKVKNRVLPWLIAVSVLARGKGSSLRSLLSDENLKAVKIKRCQ